MRKYFVAIICSLMIVGIATSTVNEFRLRSTDVVDTYEPSFSDKVRLRLLVLRHVELEVWAGLGCYLMFYAITRIPENVTCSMVVNLRL